MPRSFLSRALVALQRIVMVLTLRGSNTEYNATKRVNQRVIAIYAAANEYLPTSMKIGATRGAIDRKHLPVAFNTLPDVQNKLAISFQLPYGLVFDDGAFPLTLQNNSVSTAVRARHTLLHECVTHNICWRQCGVLYRRPTIPQVTQFAFISIRTLCLLNFALCIASTTSMLPEVCSRIDHISRKRVRYDSYRN